MRTIHTGLVILASLTLTACTDDLTATSPPSVTAAPTGPTEVGGGRQAGGDAERRRAGRAEGSIVLGDLNRPRGAVEVGAPFDPCGIGWSAFPAAVRPAMDKPADLRPVKPDEGWAIRCAYDNSGTIAIDPDGGTATQDGGTFLVSVIWGEDLETDPAKRAGSTAREWNGKPGLSATSEQKAGRGCVGLARLAHGVAAVSVTNGRFPEVDPCAVVDSVLSAITKATP